MLAWSPQEPVWAPALRLGASEPRRIKHSARLAFQFKAPGLRLHADVIKLQTLQPRLFSDAPRPEAGSEKFVFQ